MSIPEESDDLILIIRFIRAVLLAMFALVALAITVAMMWRDATLPSFFDLWFGQWSDTQLTVLAGTIDLAAWGALIMTQQSEARYRQRSSNR
jgi:hypothetical protein